MTLTALLFMKFFIKSSLTCSSYLTKIPPLLTTPKFIDYSFWEWQLTLLSTSSVAQLLNPWLVGQILGKNLSLRFIDPYDLIKKLTQLLTSWSYNFWWFMTNILHGYKIFWVNNFAIRRYLWSMPCILIKSN